MSRWRAPALAAVVGLLALVAGAGCGADRASINLNSVSGCYRALPRATQAVHDGHARFKGVHKVPADRIEKRLSQMHLAENDTEVCAFAFQGSFAPGQVEGAPANESGPYAVVLVTTKKLTLVLSFVGPRLPERFTSRV